MNIITPISERPFADIATEYRGLVRALAKKYYLPGGDREDVIQEGLMGLYKAVRDYNPDGKTSFRNFAALVIERQLITALKTASRGKAMILTQAERLEALVPEDRYTHRKEFGEFIPSVATDPLDVIVAEEESTLFFRMLSKTLSSLEIEVLRRHLAGYTIREIAADLSRSVKAVDNALTRIKNKSRRNARHILSPTAY